MTNNGRPFRAYIIAQIVLIAITFFSVMEFDIRDSLFTGIAAGIVAASFILILILHRLDRFIREAFSIPILLHIAHSFLSFLTGNYSDYFVLSLGICCLGALFFNSRELLKVIFVINAIILLQLAFGMPMEGIDKDGIRFTVLQTAHIRGIGLKQIDPFVIIKWIAALLGSVFVYIVVVFAEGKKSEAKIAHDSFVGLLSSSPDPIVLLDFHHRVKYISNSFMRMINLDNPFFAKGRPVFDLFKDQALKDLFYDILTAQEFSHATRELTLDGKQQFYEIVVYELANEVKGRLVHIIDITPIIKAKIEAESASRSKSAFLATMSHEIRTPLNAIIGLSEIELQKNLPMDTRADLEKIHGAGANLLGIINDILDISKIEAGSFELAPIEYDVPSQINDVVQLNIVRIGLKNIIFKLHVDKTVPQKLHGDDLRIKQILTNLLSNAIKYTEKGSVTLAITWEKNGEGACIHYSIKDTGYGIKQEDLPKLFSEYRQLDTKANRLIEGTGLGLTITKNLVSLMKGNIAVESAYGAGSAFTVTIPQRIIDETPIGEATARSLEQLRFKEMNRSQGLRLARNYMPYGKVLIVDDVETNLDVARGLLLPYGLFIDTALSGPEAIAKIRAADDGGPRYDLILMDHMMPGMDGVEAVRIIRNELRSDYSRMVPIVALTANALVGNEKMFLASGFNAFISKPIDLMQLDVALNVWVRSKQSVETLQLAEMEQSSAAKDLNEQRELDHVRVQGIDLLQGRAQYINESAYLGVLRSWHKHTPSLLEKLQSCSEDTLSEYAIAVHGLKGSSFGICANDIGKKAEELEALAKAGDFSGVLAQNSDFIETARATLEDLGQALEKIASGKQAKPRLPEPDAALLARLLEAAKRYKSALMEEIMDELEANEYESGGQLLAWLREQIDNLEYEAICTRLEVGRLEVGRLEVGRLEGAP